MQILTDQERLLNVHLVGNSQDGYFPKSCHFFQLERLYIFKRYKMRGVKVGRAACMPVYISCEDAVVHPDRTHPS